LVVSNQRSALGGNPREILRGLTAAQDDVSFNGVLLPISRDVILNRRQPVKDLARIGSGC
jgi:hypothetical protein